MILLNNIQNNIKRVYWLFILLFAALAIYLAKFVFIDSFDIISNSYNPRLKSISKNIVRGEILDNDGNILAANIKNDDGTETREYPYKNVFSHLVGYSKFGGSGLESKYNFELQELNFEIIQRINNIIFQKPMIANSLVLTVDTDLQSIISEKMNKQKGGAVVIEPSTGKVLAMYSYPDFDPNNIEKNWDKLRNDKENSPLLNRVTQGLYPPGSIFKVVTAAADYEYVEKTLKDEKSSIDGENEEQKTDTENSSALVYKQLDEMHYDCLGEAKFGSDIIHCFDSNVHGDINITKALTVSCNTFFSNLGIKLGGESLRKESENLFFNKEYPFVLEHSKSSVTLDGNSNEFDIAQTAIGQGETLVTPLHMAMITSAIANGGIMMQPYLVDHQISDSGKIIKKRMPKKLRQVFSLEESEYIKNMMVSVVKNGTGTPVKMKSIEIAGKTGTAQNTGADHGWFIAFAPADNPKIALAILNQNSGNTKKAMQLAKEIISQYVK